MPLCEYQIAAGAIVDHQLEIINERSGATRQRAIVRRGRIVRVDQASSGRKEIYVQFKRDAEPEVVPNAELTLFKRAVVSMVRKAAETAELYSERSAVPPATSRPVVVDEMGVTKESTERSLIAEDKR